MKRILVPTDFSETANKGRDYAVQLAQVLNAEVILLNSYHIPLTGAGAGTLVNLDRIAGEEAKKSIKEQIAYLRLNYSNITFKSLCTTGLLVDTIKRVCNTENIDLVVMGTIGATGFVNNVLGSNTAALIGAIKTPIIAVPDKATIKFPEHMVVANDLVLGGEEELFEPLKEIIAGTNSSIDFLFVVDEEYKLDNKIQRVKAANFDEEFDVQYHPFHFRNSENIEDGILDYITKKEVDLLVVVSHQRNFWEKLFQKSISKSLVKSIDIPILVLSK
jgi:nucleotide-binding universal stress UspA family protein